MKLWVHQKTDNPYFVAVLTANKINRLCGGAVIAPWEIDQLPDDWLDAIAEMEKRMQ